MRRAGVDQFLSKEAPIEEIYRSIARRLANSESHLRHERRVRFQLYGR